ncbi:hypothetical protein [Leptolyngbya sp. PCC 6406]|uniref:hypothetical protein n=1 Tax=Leptolyngbya sp. PCC 6406 TaxID=1173264 RepID=UPI0002AC8B2B|nr:hypothetical protein [Leptolyngbya sp. PCC 6406]
MVSRLQYQSLTTAVVLSAIALSSCDGQGPTPSATTPAIPETPAQIARDPNGPPLTGLLAECAAVQSILNGEFNHGFGAHLTATASQVKGDDSALSVGLTADAAVGGMATALTKAQATVTSLTAVDLSDVQLLSYRDAYRQELQEMLAEMESAQTFYAQLKAATDAANPTGEQTTVLDSGPTQTMALAERLKAHNQALEKIDDDIFNYCLEAELDAEFPEN